MGRIELTDLNGNGPYMYKVDHLHMHGPSEHKINGQQFDLEMHIVHVIEGGVGNWQKYKDTLAVVGFMFKVADHSHPFVEKLNVFDFDIIDKINFAELLGFKDDYSYQKHGVSEEQYLMDQQKKYSNSHFYHYKGSLTNPPCSDVVNWNVFKEVLPIT